MYLHAASKLTAHNTWGVQGSYLVGEDAKVKPSSVTSLIVSHAHHAGVHFSNNSFFAHSIHNHVAAKSLCQVATNTSHHI